MDNPTKRPKTPIRVNALAMAIISAVLVVFVILILDDPAPELIIALAAPVVVGCVAVMDKLCSPEPNRQEWREASDEYLRHVQQLFDKALAAAPHVPSSEADAHQQGKR